MPPRKTRRLAYGEYVIPEHKENTAVWIARLELMDRVKRLFPTMLKRLSSDVFPFYERLAQAGFDFDSILWNSRVSPYPMLPGDKPEVQLSKKTGTVSLVQYDSRLKSALAQWASDFHAESGWFLDEALRTLRGWYVAPDWRNALEWNHISGVSSTLAWGERFQFDCEGWEMQTLTWAAYSKSVRERFEQTLAEYEAASRKLAESRGLVRVPHKYSPSNFDWFVLYQFAGLSSHEITTRNTDPKSIDDNTVLKGVGAAAKLVGWDRLRTAPKRGNRKIR